MRTLDPVKLSEKVVKGALERLSKVKKDFPTEYGYFIDWASNFACYAEYHLEQNKILETIKTCQYEVSNVENEISI